MSHQADNPAGIAARLPAKRHAIASLASGTRRRLVHNNDRTRRVVDDLLADRSEQQTPEAAEAASADNDQLRVGALREKHTHAEVAVGQMHEVAENRLALVFVDSERHGVLRDAFKHHPLEPQHVLERFP
jgi:hypothetical protein